MKQSALLPGFLALPILLLISTSLVFAYASQSLGKGKGYLFGFAFYWLFWCLLVPWLAVRKRGFLTLLTDDRALFTRQNWPAAFMWIIVTLIALLMYAPEMLRAPFLLILLAVPLAAINGFSEEILWRGLYVKSFPVNPWLGIVLPAFGFAFWHFAPQIIIPAENPTGFILSTLFLGLAYGFIAFRTGSAKWTAISHSLNGAFALASPLAETLLVVWVGVNR